MKKLSISAHFALLLLFLVSCGANNSHQIEPTPSISSITISVEDIESAIKEAVGSSIPYSYLTVKTTDKGRLDISADICDSSEITYFATYVDALLNACSQNVDMTIVHKITLNQCDKDGRTEVIFRTVEEGFGELIDWRSGEAELQSIASLDDLMDLYPASKVVQSEKENLTDSELKIYNEVWSALDTEPSRPEEEIFEELAPNYGMTGSELRDFMMNAMEKVYE